MANIKVGLSKKSTVILLLLFFVLIGGGGGYLLWRVNQAKTVAPTDSDASEAKYCTRCKPGTCTLNRHADGNCYGDSSGEQVGCTKTNGQPGCCKWSDTEQYECGVKFFHIMFIADSGGTVSPTIRQDVSPGGSKTGIATPNSDYEFAGWEGSGGGDVSDKSQKQLTISNVNSDATYTAKFREKEAPPEVRVTLKYAGGNLGFVNGENEVVQTPVKGQNNTVVAVKATPKDQEKYRFIKWSDNITDNPRKDNADKDITVTAIFEKTPTKEHKLTYKVESNGKVKSGSANQTVRDGGDGTGVAVEANEGYKFDKWTESISGKSRSEITNNKDKTVSLRQDYEVKDTIIITAKFKKACGDNICDSWEDMTSCPADCKGCGDGKCTPPENAETCAKDCKAVCGDKLCTHDENAETCPEDCKARCGDNICSPSENAQTCPEDCPVNCGDGICSEDEDPQNCPADCTSVCGDGMCTGDESSEDCPEDCGAPVVGEAVPETGLFDETKNVVIMGVVLLVLGMTWTWVSTLPKKAYVSISDTVSSVKKRSVERERNSRRSKLEERIK